MIDRQVEIVVFTTGGTIDKVYFDAQSEYEVGHSVVPSLLKQARVTAPVQVISLMAKDSLELDDVDRELIRKAVSEQQSDRIVITHGTDTMELTAHALSDIRGKTIVLTGALAPARFAETDAIFNVGLAFGAVQSLPHGVYIAMNGQIFDGQKVSKNRSAGRFEPTSD